MRIPPVTARDHLDDEGRAAFDRIVETRGEILRPFQAFLHSPAVARSVADLGHVVRSRSHLGDRDRELVTVATGRARACPFIWESHLDAARRAGLREESIQALVPGGEGLGGRERLLATFVSELCETGAVAPGTFGAALGLLGTAGVVDLVVTIGYYSMLADAMRALDAC